MTTSPRLNVSTVSSHARLNLRFPSQPHLMNDDLADLELLMVNLIVTSHLMNHDLAHVELFMVTSHLMNDDLADLELFMRGGLLRLTLGKRKMSPVLGVLLVLHVP
jgi:hypothetical protein